MVCNSCNSEFDLKDAKFIGIQFDILELYNCPSCNTTFSRKYKSKPRRPLMGMGILTIALILTAILTHKHDTEKKKAKVEAEFLLEDVELEVEEEVREVNYEVKLIDRAPAVVKKKRSKK